MIAGDLMSHLIVGLILVWVIVIGLGLIFVTVEQAIRGIDTIIDRMAGRKR